MDVTLHLYLYHYEGNCHASEFEPTNLTEQQLMSPR